MDSFAVHAVSRGALKTSQYSPHEQHMGWHTWQGTIRFAIGLPFKPDLAECIGKHIGEVVCKGALVPPGSQALLLQGLKGGVGGQGWGAMQGPC